MAAQFDQRDSSKSFDPRDMLADNQSVPSAASSSYTSSSGSSSSHERRYTKKEGDEHSLSADEDSYFESDASPDWARETRPKQLHDSQNTQSNSSRHPTPPSTTDSSHEASSFDSEDDSFDSSKDADDLIARYANETTTKEKHKSLMVLMKERQNTTTAPPPSPVPKQILGSQSPLKSKPPPSPQRPSSSLRAQMLNQRNQPSNTEPLRPFSLPSPKKNPVPLPAPMSSSFNSSARKKSIPPPPAAFQHSPQISTHHLEGMNQPIEHRESDGDSLESDDLFDGPKGPLPAKPLLAAAMKARAQADKEQGNSINHLEGMNQPTQQHESDGESLSSGDLFDGPKGPPPAKPLLEAAKKARAQAEQEQSNSATHLEGMHQPIEQHESDGESLGSRDLFDDHRGPPVAKPLLAAAQKARAQAGAEERGAAHLQGLNQPIEQHESDGESLGSVDLFDGPKGPSPAKPLLAAALKARKQAETERASKEVESLSSHSSNAISYGLEESFVDPYHDGNERPTLQHAPSVLYEHLLSINQPIMEHDSDGNSIESGALFETPQVPQSKKPLLDAAMKARDQMQAPHLQGINQPVLEHDSDKDSLESDELFDASKGPPSAKPLLAAALKAREQAEASHMQGINQPILDHDSDKDSLGSNELFDAPNGPPTTKPLLAAALKAREQAEAHHLKNTNQPIGRRESDTYSLAPNQLFDEPKGPSTAKPMLAAAIKAREQAEAYHLKGINQPKVEHESDSDSLESNELFDAPQALPQSKPLLAAALKARKQAEDEQKGIVHLEGMNQPVKHHASDADSLESSQLFDAPKGPPPARPLLAAAIKAREQAEASHLKGISQPILEHGSDNDSLGSGELFDTPTGPPPAKPLLAAAKKARAQAESEQSSSGAHLQGINQPIEKHGSDGDSLESGDLFDAPAGPRPDKPLLAAAQKAREQAEAEQTQEASHLQGINQPIIEHESDRDSLGSEELFEAPAGPPPAKPLLAAAIKAREQAQVTAEENQPSIDYDKERRAERRRRRKMPAPMPEVLVSSPADDDSTLGSMGWLFTSDKHSKMTYKVERSTKSSKPNMSQEYQKAQPERIKPRTSRESNDAPQGELTSWAGPAQSYYGGRQRPPGISQDETTAWCDALSPPRLPKGNPARGKKAPVEQEMKSLSELNWKVNPEKKNEPSSTRPWLAAPSHTWKSAEADSASWIPQEDSVTARKRTLIFSAEDSCSSSTWAPPQPVARSVRNPPLPNSSHINVTKMSAIPNPATWSKSVGSGTIWEQPKVISDRQKPAPTRNVHENKNRGSAAGVSDFGESISTLGQPKIVTEQRETAREDKKKTRRSDADTSVSEESKSTFNWVPSQARYVDYTGVVQSIQSDKKKNKKSKRKKHSSQQKRKQDDDFSDEPWIVPQRPYWVPPTSENAKWAPHDSSGDDSQSRNVSSSTQEALPSQSSKSRHDLSEDDSHSHSMVASRSPQNSYGDSSNSQSVSEGDAHSPAPQSGNILMQNKLFGVVNAMKASASNGGESEGLEAAASSEEGEDHRAPSVENGTSEKVKSENIGEKGLLLKGTFVVLGLILLAAVILIIIFVGRRFANDDKGDDDAIPLTPSPSFSPVEAQADLLNLIISFSPETENALNDPTSPQKQGFDWLLENQFYDSYSKVTKLQRFVMATTFYATDGLKWKKSDFWLSDIDECDWYSSEIVGNVCTPQDQLTELHLSGNKLDGALPWQELSILQSHLMILDFDNNRLSGTIPASVAFFNLLSYLDLYDNTLIGEVPKEIGKLTNLRYLSLGENSLSGSLPVEISNIKSLEELWLNDNMFTGPIPSQLGRLSNLKHLYLVSTLGLAESLY